MSAPVYAQIKIVGPSADKLRSEAAARKISLNALCSEYLLQGLSIAGPDDDALAGVERRVVSTLLGTRAEIDTLAASVDILAALVDTLTKSLMIHLPAPSPDETDAVVASALERYTKLLEQTATSGFDERRPRAIQRIAELMMQHYPRAATTEENEEQAE